MMENSAGVNVDSHKIKMVLAVKVEKVDADLKAGCLRVNGRNVKENKHVKVGNGIIVVYYFNLWLAG